MTTAPSEHGFFKTITTMLVEGNLFSSAHGFIFIFFVRIRPNVKWQIDRGNNEEPADVIEPREILMLNFSNGFNIPVKKPWDL